MKKLLKLSLTPQKLPKESREQVSLQMIITLEAIWNLRNQITHNGGEINLISTIKGIEARVQEFLLSQELPPQHIHMDVTKWSTPPPNVVKLNVDAAILRNHSTLAVIARNDKGEVLKAWAKQSKCCDPLQAETSAVLWALQLAASESFMHIIIEGDAKVCFDAIADNSPAPWTVSSLINNITKLSNSFLSCCFCWIRRGANDAAHTLAKFASHSSFPLYCNYDSLPLTVWEVCMRDVCALSA